MQSPAQTPVFGLRLHFVPVCALMASWLFAAFGPPAMAAEKVRGLPFTRLHSFEEIASITGPSHLTFDRFGRIVAVKDGAYVALNDTTWIDLAEKDPDAPRILHAVRDSDDTMYFGAFIDWGTLETTDTGKLRPRSLKPEVCPPWVASTYFNEILCTEKGVYFAGWNGVVFWDRDTKTHSFFAVESVARIFSYRGEVFVSSHSAGVRRIDVERGALTETAFGTIVVDNAVQISDEAIIVSTTDRRLLLYRGGDAVPWSAVFGEWLPARVLSMRRLPDGHVALSISGLGVFVMNASSEIVSSLTLPEYRRVIDLASNEPGVLWASTENGIAKILYGSALTVFGQPLGLPISWPQLVHWRGRLLISSAGRLYEPLPAPATESTRFQLVPNQPANGAWGVAVMGRDLLVGNNQGVHLRQEDGTFQPILRDIDVARLVVVDSTLCFAIGSREIAALRWENGAWRECAPRVPGLGYPSMVHAAKHSAWIELGANRAARLALREGRIQPQVFESFPWSEPRWIDISTVGDITVLTGGEKGRVFFDETAETIHDAPELRALLDRSPYWIIRVREDEDGTLWATHEHGLIRLSRGAESYDSAPYDLVVERSPRLHLLPDGEKWISTGDTLLRVEPQGGTNSEDRFAPRLVSMRDTRRNVELLGSRFSPLRYDQNSIEFRFFAGSYASRRPPKYRVRLDDEHWNQLETGSLLSVSDLREGQHRLEVMLIDAHGRPGKADNVLFAISPPWHRTWYAFVLYALAAATLVALLVFLSVRRTRKRNRELAKLVEHRTAELRSTMKKLNDETRHSATLTERQRLAGEIHDSLQQGLTGLTLQLDATLKLSDLSTDARSRLNMARSLLSFSRQELQNAVLGIQSSLLDHSDLGTALQKLSEFIGSGAARVEVVVRGCPTAFPASVQHDLLRIAQEAVTNAVRHGAADMITITLEYTSGSISLKIFDNGRGFDPHAVSDSGLGHFGLRSLRSRASRIGAQPDIQSAPGRGTTITITLPRPQIFAYATGH